GAGCYGHNGADDVALDAALLARATNGRPVRLQWMRDDEMKWEPYGPAMTMRAKGAVAEGHVVDWNYDVYSQSHNMRPGDPDGVAACALLNTRPPRPTMRSSSKSRSTVIRAPSRCRGSGPRSIPAKSSTPTASPTRSRVASCSR